MDALLDAWLRDHNATLAPAQNAHRSPLRDLEPGSTAPSRNLQTHAEPAEWLRDDLGVTAPQSTPGITSSPQLHPATPRWSRDRPRPAPGRGPTHQGGVTPSPEASGDAGPQRQRYVVAMGQELLVALRVHAARKGQRMGTVVADAVTALLEDAAAGHPIPELEPRWNAPSADRSRLAMSWPPGLADRLRDAVAGSGRPAHELVAVAVIPVVAPRRGAGR